MDMTLTLDDVSPKARLAVLLTEFSRLGDDREQWRVMYPLSEVLLLLTCATITSCDDFDDIAAWGKHHIGFLRRFAAFHHGIPGERWLRTLVNRVDPVLFGRCFDSWIAALWPDRHDVIAIKPAPAKAGGKTARAAPMTSARVSRPCTPSAPMPPMPDCRWRSSRCPKRPMRSPPSPIYSTSLPATASLQVPS